MESLAEIRARLVAGQFEFSRHALRRAVERSISEAEIRQAGKRARIIEDYADDKYTPSCLLLGFTDAERPLHLQYRSLAPTPNWSASSRFMSRTLPSGIITSNGGEYVSLSGVWRHRGSF